MNFFPISKISTFLLWRNDRLYRMEVEQGHSEGWPVQTYGGIKSYAPPSGSVPSDVVPGKYEGGYQLWECTVDLLQYMDSLDFKGKHVFEMGCGRGLPGIYAALHGASSVVLQDYNQDVIERLTAPNVVLNNCPANVVSFSGSAWSDAQQLFPAQSYDVILASETIYRKEQLPCFVNAIKHLMKKDGIAIVAAKRTYFGVSGSTLDLIELMKDEFKFELKEYKDPKVAYKREVIALQYK